MKSRGSAVAVSMEATALRRDALGMRWIFAVDGSQSGVAAWVWRAIS
jgi:ribosomal protein S7